MDNESRVLNSVERRFLIQKFPEINTLMYRFCGAEEYTDALGFPMANLKFISQDGNELIVSIRRINGPMDAPRAGFYYYQNAISQVFF